MNLAEFREKYPHRPNALAYLRGDRDHVMTEVEVISYPYEEGIGTTKPAEVLVQIRTVPGNPGTLAETNVKNLILVPGSVRCDKHVAEFIPYPSVRSAGVTDREAKTLCINCHICGRGYFYVTEQYLAEFGPGEPSLKLGVWECDRPLEICMPCKLRRES